MIPAEKVVAVCPNDPVRKVMDLMLVNKIGSVIVLEYKPKKLRDGNQPHIETLLPMPVGIITKSDILMAYQSRMGVDAKCSAIMSHGDLLTCNPNMSRDQAARVLEESHHHHIIVVDAEHEHFMGLVSSWDISAECAKDGRAWPWIRTIDGKIHSPKLVEKQPAQLRSNSPTSATNGPTSNQGEHEETIFEHQHDEFTTYMDDLDLLCLM